MVETLQAFARDAYDALVPLLVAGAVWLLLRFAKAVLRRLDVIADLPHAFDRLSDELAALRDDHESRITRIESHLNGATP